MASYSPTESFTDSSPSTSTPGRLIIPDRPCPHGYLANPHQEAKQRGWNAFYQLLSAPPEIFQNLGEKAGVARYRCLDPSLQMTTLDTLKGTVYMEGVKPVDVFSCIHQAAYRLIWDTRLASASIIERYSQTEFIFYLVTRGIGPIYWERDVVGCQFSRSYLADGSMAEDIVMADCPLVDIMWTTVDRPDIGPQEGKMRAQITLAGYRIEARGNGCQVTYFVSIDLAVPIPAFIRKALCNDLPVALARLRDAIPTFGVPPYVLDLQRCIALQQHYWNPETRVSVIIAMTTSPGTFVIMLDSTRMYPSGILMPTITGQGAKSVTIQEAFTGDRIFVHLTEAGLFQEWILTFEPRDQDPEPTDQSSWW